MSNSARISPHDLPEPDEQALLVSKRLQQLIADKIADAGGVISFARFMELALYAPGLGYYRAGAARFGAGGDFSTAPELSALFGRTLARQIAEIMAHLGGAEVIELGPGTGKLAVDALAELKSLGALPQRWRMLEVSGALRAEQAQTLSCAGTDLLDRVEWLEQLPEDSEKSIWIANEVIDALPVRRFIRTDDGVLELGVANQANSFAWSRMAADKDLVAAVEAIESRLGRLPTGYVSEVCTRLPAFINGIAQSLQRGVTLWIDYGYPRREYYLPERGSGTLICHYRHRAHNDPFLYPGLQDITAFVDFSALADALMGAGLDLLGYAPQGPFLLGGGLAELARSDIESADERQRLAASQSIQRLTHPGDMGEKFKVMAAGRGYSGPISGFRLSDRRGFL
ncbi:SAM-dependent methyltransferase [Halorhodospira halochloris]|uniref:class I SAM-dependent methyltransferase n=1 Tax=Halorhodospira halochloris TaxID=1052 RepID=UPI001EE8B19B|nr:SAM-dependent methyltransferase [Halorhodospira halochloris]MCG5529813.1 SAM-dependent methyltransferase [Halorhodospira halochloris]